MLSIPPTYIYILFPLYLVWIFRILLCHLLINMTTFDILFVWFCSHSSLSSVDPLSFRKQAKRERGRPCRFFPEKIPCSLKTSFPVDISSQKMHRRIENSDKRNWEIACDRRHLNYVCNVSDLYFHCLFWNMYLNKLKLMFESL